MKKPQEPNLWMSLRSKLQKTNFPKENSHGNLILLGAEKQESTPYHGLLGMDTEGILRVPA